MTTRAVLDELRRAAESRPNLRRIAARGWPTEVRVDGIDTLLPLHDWLDRLGARDHDRGEATVLAFAEAHAAVAIVDDARARTMAHARGLAVHGTLWLVARACRTGLMPEPAAAGFVNALRDSGARLPCDGHEFPDWARANGLLPRQRIRVNVRRRSGGP